MQHRRNGVAGTASPERRRRYSDDGRAMILQALPRYMKNQTVAEAFCISFHTPHQLGRLTSIIAQSASVDTLSAYPENPDNLPCIFCISIKNAEK